MLLRCRENRLGLVVDEKFRNLNGLKMQIGCIHYVVTEGRVVCLEQADFFIKHTNC